MESPATLSRSSSFAPGSHRRSHPNLQHLSLAPLTPKYPIDPADYSAYFDPSTSELHTSASISHIASLPSPGGILSSSRPGSAAHSRASSRTRLSTAAIAKRKNKSLVTIQTPSVGTPSGALSSEGLGHSKLIVPATDSTTRLSSPLHKSDSSWLIQTGLTLTEGSRESKGQSWLSKRDSSTSLATPIDERPSIGLRSGRTTPGAGHLSRRGSFQRRSRRSLAMTPAAAPPAAPMIDIAAPPDWADANAQAEAAAQIDADFAPAEEFFSDEDGEDGDPYGVLDFEGQFDSDDEDELRRSIKGYGLGGWMDGLVDVFLRLEDDFPGSQVDATTAAATEALRKKKRKEKGIPEESGVDDSTTATSTAVRDGESQPAGPSVSFDEPVEPPPEKPKSVWDDVAWFGRMVARTVQS